MDTPSRLSLAELERYQPHGSGKPSGGKVRYLCPVHGGDHQRSLSVDPESGHFKCHMCGAWGYLDGHQPSPARSSDGRKLADLARAPVAPRPEPKGRPELVEVQKSLEAAFTQGSWGERYLKFRGIPPELARAYGAGYAAPGHPPRFRKWKRGRVTFPHTTPAGEIVNVYGRAIGTNDEVEKGLRHNHLKGDKGVFNAPVLAGEVVYIAESALDALSLIAAGYPEACAIFGVDGMRWEWLRANRVVFCFDQDEAGRKWRALAWEAVLRGKAVYWLPPEVFGGCKDLNEAWVKHGRLDLGEWEDRPCEQVSVHLRSPGER